VEVKLILSEKPTMRQCIERAFGILVRRWGILWPNLECSYERWHLVLLVCAKLHNLCMDEDKGEGIQLQRDDRDYGDLELVHLSSEPNLPDPTNEFYISSRVVEKSERRNNIIATFEHNGWRRPYYALNS
jgi:hypothetical protein